MTHISQGLKRPSLVRAKLNFARAQMDLIIQEVSDAVDARMSENIAAARKEAQGLRCLSEILGELMQIPVVDIAHRSGLPLFAKAICELAEATGYFEGTFKSFADEHGALLEEEAKKTLAAFFVWIREQEKVLAPIWEEYVATLDRDLTESRDEIRRTASEWSAVDGDGLV
jgi:hypothetical protein